MTAPATLRRVCAWCKGILDGGAAPLPGEPVSHGICEACRLAQLRHWRADNDADPDGNYIDAR